MSRYKGKTVGIVGLSVEGLDSAKFFTSEGSRVICCDRRTKEELGETHKALHALGVEFRLGPDYLSDISIYDYIIRTPGMSLETPEFQVLLKEGKEISSLTKIFFDECQASIIGVTGTKGKGTTTTLIHEMLLAQGKGAWLGGNVGTPLLSQVRRIQPGDIVTLELSSFQLEDLHKSPHVAVVLRVTQEHLANFDRNATNFHRSRMTYVKAKESIVKYQRSSDIVITDADDETSNAFATLTPATRYEYGQVKTNADAYIADHAVYIRTSGSVQRVCSLTEIKLRGEHNLENIAAATLAAHTVGVEDSVIQFVAKQFPGLEHRLEDVREVDGVLYNNDTFSTVPETTIAAIHTFAARPIILIVGGSEKGSDFTQLGREIAKSSVKALIVIGAMRDRIIEAVRVGGYRNKIISDCRSMHEIVTVARKESYRGDVVLLSPACASFDMFDNYKDRGKQFKYEVSIL